MNKKRRSELNKLQDRITAAREAFEAAYDEFKSQADDIRDALDGIKDAEQEAFDNLSEGLQSGDRGQLMQDAINELETAAAVFGDIADSDLAAELDSAFESIENAKGSAE